MVKKTRKKVTPKRKAAAKKPVEALTLGERPDIDIDAFTDYLKARLGGKGVVIQDGRDIEGRADLRRPCGIKSLDIATGGGLPVGGLSQIDGPEGIGKNVLAYRYFAETQRLYGDDTRIFMVAFEKEPDKAFAWSLGFKIPYSDYEIGYEQRRRQEEGRPLLDNEEVAEMQDTAGRGVFKVVQGDAEGSLDVLVELISANIFQIGLVDSWDAMLTAPEDNTALLDDPRIASPATVQTRWMKKVFHALAPKLECFRCRSPNLEHKALSNDNFIWVCAACGWRGKSPYACQNETTIIGIRQVRANMRKTSMRQRDYTVGGAWALKHGKLVSIQLRPGERLMDGKIRSGKEINWEITKGKMGTHEGHTGAFHYYYDPPTIDIEQDMINCCTTGGIIARGGSVYSFEGPNGLIKWQGKNALAEAIADDEELRETLWKAVLKKANLSHVRYTPVPKKGV